jgi:GNAT superfamily N-acetyltransferase
MRPPERLVEIHDTSSFDCGHPELNDWLLRQAPLSEGRSARTYVVATEGRVAAYYSLAAGSVLRDAIPRAKLRRNLPEQVPVIVLARLAVDRKSQGQGLGKALLRDAIARTLGASEIAGVRALFVHAIDDAAAGFYRQYGFLESPSDPRTLFLPLETALQAL